MVEGLQPAVAVACSFKRNPGSDKLLFLHRQPLHGVKNHGVVFFLFELLM